MAYAQRKAQNDFGTISDENHAAVEMVPAPEVISENLNRAASKSLASPQALSEKAYRALHIGFVAVPMVAGIDKFANVLTDWTHYLAPIIPASLGVSPSAFMVGVGVAEVGIGIGLALKPRIFADVFAAWLMLVIVNLLVQGDSFDVALFDFGLAAGACALARLSHARRNSQPRSARMPIRPLRRVE